MITTLNSYEQRQFPRLVNSYVSSWHFSFKDLWFNAAPIYQGEGGGEGDVTGGSEGAGVKGRVLGKKNCVSNYERGPHMMPCTHHGYTRQRRELLLRVGLR